MHKSFKSLVILSQAFNIANAGSVSAQMTSSVKITEIGAPEVVYKWGSDRCGEEMYPDAPARAFLQDTSSVFLIAANNTNWFMRGQSLNKLNASCTSAFSASGQSSSQEFDSSGWIEATFALDGRDVLALVSNDWSTSQRSLQNKADQHCRTSDVSSCHYFSINLAKSTNGGRTFSYVGQEHMLAALPISDLSDKHMVVGFATASNLFQAGAYVYSFLGRRAQNTAASGSCLFRFLLSDPSEWQFWDGQSFVNEADSRFAREEQQASLGHCKPVHVAFQGAVELRSVSYFAACRCYVGVFEGAKRTTESVTSGFFTTTSKDLLSWSTPQLLLSRRLNSECREILVYPSLLDPGASTRNFSDITTHAYLYYTRINRTSCKGTLDRDLVRIPMLVDG